MIHLSKSFYPLEKLNNFKISLQGNDTYNWEFPAELLTDESHDFLNSILELDYDLIHVASVADASDTTDMTLTLPAVNFFRYAPIDKGNIFVSVDTGHWMILDEDEFRMLKNSRFTDPVFYRRLEKNFILLTEHNIQSYIKKIRVKYGFLKEGPTLHIIVVTNNCNLHCIYCQASAGNQTSGKINMTPDTAVESVNRIFESPSDSFIIEFQGGEPLMNFSVVKRIIEYATDLAQKNQKQVEFSLISNFTHIATEEKLRFLVEHNVSICFSLDGPKELHERNRGKNYPGAFDVLKGKIELYRKVWSESRSDAITLKALMTTTAASLPLFKEIVNTYLDIGITELNIRALTPLGRAEAFYKDINYSPEEFLSFWKHVVSYILELRKSGHDVSEFYLGLILTKLFGNESGYMDLRSPCGASYGQIVYNYDGNVYSCDEGRMIRSDRFIVGNVHRQKLDSILRRKNAVSIFDASIMEQFFCDHCAYKPYCGICPVLNYQKKESFFINILESDRCAIHSEMIRHVIELLLNDKEARDEFQKILLNVDWQKVG